MHGDRLQAKLSSLVALSLLVCGSRALATIRYVDSSAAGANNGSSWTDAYVSLQSALSLAVAGDEIRVADTPAATNYYKPTTTTDRTISFQLRSGVAMYGGYAGSGAANPDARDVAAFPTILSGDIATVNTLTDDTHHVVNATGTDNTCILDGFTIRDGYANVASSGYNNGGGLYAEGGSPTVRNCTFTNNSASNFGAGYYSVGNPVVSNCTFNANNPSLTGSRGGGMYSQGDAIVRNCSFTSNRASSRGAGLANIAGSPIIEDCTFTSNVGTSSPHGMGIYNESTTLATINRCSFSSHTSSTSSTIGLAMANEGGGTVVMDRCTFTSNTITTTSTTTRCAALYNNSTNVTLTNCDFIGNTMASSTTGSIGGAAMYNASSNIVLTNCRFLGNRTNGTQGGAIYISSTNGNNPVLTNCLFSGNTVSAGFGGAIYCTSANPTLTNCTFSRNSAGTGGAIIFLSSNPIMANCILWGDTASTAGPEIAVQSSSNLAVSYSDVQGNSAGVSVQAGCTLTWTPGNIEADPLFVDSDGGDNTVGTADDDLHLSSAPSPCVNAGNDSSIPPGITTDFEGQSRIQQCRVDMGADEAPYAAHDCNSNTFEDACDVLSGTSLDCNSNGKPDQCDPQADCNNNTIQDICDIAGGTTPDCNTNNVPDSCDIASGTSVDCNSNAIPDSCDIAAGTGSDCDANGILDQCETLGTGTRIYVNDDAPGSTRDGLSWGTAFTSLQTALCVASGHANVTEIWVASGTYVPTQRYNVFDPRTVYFQLVNGVAMYGGFAGTETQLDQRNIAGNVTNLSGDYQGDSSLPNNAYHVVVATGMDNTCILDGFTIKEGYADVASGGNNNGGGLYAETGSPTVRNCTFTNNQASNFGAGYYSVGNPAVSNCTFSSNNSSLTGSRGGGMYSQGDAIVRNCSFTSNRASSRGAGLANISGSPIVEDCTFTSNVGTSSPHGMGIYNESTTLATINRCSFSSHTSSTSSTIGLAMANEGGGTVVMDRCTFTSNTITTTSTTTRCAALYNNSTNVTLTNCDFIGNTMASSTTGSIGGAAMYNASSNIVLTNCRFLGNRTNGTQGGAIYISSTNGNNPVLTNCLFSGNTVSAGFGGAIYCTSANPTLTNCTFSRNSAGTGGAIIFLSSNPIMANCILWGDTASTAGPEIAVQSSSNLAVSYSDVQGNSAGVSVQAGCTLTWTPGNIEADPLFVDSDGGDNTVGTADDDLHLNTGSPCLNAGSDASIPGGITTDFEGQARVQQCRVDMGCDEAPYTVNDCNSNTFEDACDVLSGTSLDCNSNGKPDQCDPQADCNNNTIQDICDIAGGTTPDCNTNNVPDSCDIASGTSVDCNSNAIPDSCDIAAGTGSDCDANGILDQCETLGTGTRIYVNDDAPGSTRDGLSWGTAFTSLQTALCVASGHANVTEIWVASGTYVPTQRYNVFDPRTVYFQLVNGVAMYGGFAGTETQLDQRNIAGNVTNLSGDYQGDSSLPNNAYHVVVATGMDNTCILDGFTIKEGYADVASGGNNNGGGLYAETGSPTVRNCTFTNNQASNFGAGYYSVGNPAVSNCTFSSNNSSLTGSRGGGMYSQGDAIVRNCSFTSNRASSRGAGLANISGSPIVEDCTFTSNVGTSSPHGMGIYNESTTLATINRCSFSSHTSSTSSTIGLAMANEGGGTVVMDRCTFTSNTITTTSTTTRCAALYNNSTNVTLTNCDFIGNTMASSTTGSIGGAAMYNASSNIVLTNCRFLGNRTNGTQGGAIYISSTNGNNPVLTNCLFSGNTVSAGFGGAIYCTSANPTLTNCTFSRNSAGTGGAIIFLSSNPIMANCILWGDTASTAGPEIAVQSSSNLAVSYSDVQGHDATGILVEAGSSLPNYSSSHNIDADPQFLDSDGGDNTVGTTDDDLHIPSTSPCLDAGDNNAVPSGITTDLGNNPRFINDPAVDTGSGTPPLVDMGAYERQEQLIDCNTNGRQDAIDISGATSRDCNANAIPDECDIANAVLTDSDTDGIANICDACPLDANNDIDGDTVCGNVDNCPTIPNTNQADADTDGIGTACDACPLDPNNDIDGDTVCGNVDNCPTTANTNQANADGDALGDACDACQFDPNNDIDGDTVCGNVYNCPTIANTDQANADGDALGDACDACPLDANNDIDGDTICGDVDNCPTTANTNQADADTDGIGTACDACPLDPDNDIDGDTVCGNVDNCPTTANTNQADADTDGIGTACDACPLDRDNDIDTDGVCGNVDNCRTTANSDQADADTDGAGDACDSCPNDPGKIVPGVCGCGVPDVDTDHDTVLDCNDRCPGHDDLQDCNTNGTPDGCDITAAHSFDCNSDDVPDECQAGRWIGADGASFSDPASWNPNGVPNIDAVLTNTGATDRHCMITAPTALCHATIGGTGAGEMIVVIGSGKTFTPSTGTRLDQGGKVDLRGGELAGGPVTNTSNTILGYGVISASIINSGRIESSSIKTLEFTGASFTNLAAGTLKTSVGSGVRIQAASLSQAGLIEVHGNGSLVFDTALTNSAGGMLRLYAGVLGAAGLTNATGATIYGTGTLESNVTNNGNMIAIADTLVVGNLVNDGTVTVQGGILTVTGNLSGSGTVIGGFGGRDGAAGTGSAGGLKIRGNLSMPATASLLLPGGTLEVAGDFDVAIDRRQRFDLAAAMLQMNGRPVQGPQTLEVLSSDLGKDVTLPAAWSLDKLRVGPNATTARLVNQHANSGRAVREVLYVRRLVLDPGATLDLAGQTLYYGSAVPADPSAPGSGVAVIDTMGGGKLARMERIRKAAAESQQEKTQAAGNRG